MPWLSLSNVHKPLLVQAEKGEREAGDQVSGLGEFGEDRIAVTRLTCYVWWLRWSISVLRNNGIASRIHIGYS